MMVENLEHIVEEGGGPQRVDQDKTLPRWINELFITSNQHKKKVMIQTKVLRDIKVQNVRPRMCIFRLKDW